MKQNHLRALLVIIRTYIYERKLIKKLCSIIILFMSFHVIFAEETKEFSTTPLLMYEYLQLEEQKIHSSGTGIIFSKGNMLPPLTEERSSLLLVGMYNQFYVMESRDDYKDLYHDIKLFAEKKSKQHLFLGVLNTRAAEPFYGGFHTFTVGTGYAYEFIRNDNISFYLGAGFIVSDFGLEFCDGKTWPIIPLPLVRFDLETSLLNFSFQLADAIAIYFTFLPESKVRFTSSLYTEPLDIRNIRDVYFDAALWYRFFSKESKMGDFMGIGLGINSKGFSFDLLEKNKTYEVNYFSVYGIWDISFLKLSAGYMFKGREIFDWDRINNLGNGFFISTTLGWQF